MTTHGGTGYFDVGTHTVHIDFTAPEWTDPNGEIQLGEVTISGYDGGFTWDPSTAEVWTTTSGLEDFSQNPDPNTFGEENHFAGPAPHEGTTTSLGKAKATVDGEPGTDATIDIDDVWFFTISQDPIAPQVWATYCEPADGQERRLATIPIRLPSGG